MTFLLIFLNLLFPVKQHSGFPCNSYKTGKFYYYTTIASTKYTIRVERNDSLQMETMEPAGVTANLKIKWIDSCSFELRYTGGLQSPPDSVKEVLNKMVLSTTILSGTDHYYISRTSTNIDDRVLMDTMWIQK